MAVLIEGLSVVLRCASIGAKHPGGHTAFVCCTTAVRGAVSSERELIRIGHEAPEDVTEVKLRLEFADRVLEANEGYFQAVRELRRLLEADGMLLVCNGASRDVYPSTMTESMGYAEKAYRHTLGRAAGSDDLMNIFDVGPDLCPSTLGEQREFHEKWLDSLI